MCTVLDAKFVDCGTRLRFTPLTSILNFNSLQEAVPPALCARKQ